jgi:hypothetical protein
MPSMSRVLQRDNLQRLNSPADPFQAAGPLHAPMEDMSLDIRHYVSSRLGINVD